MMFIVAETFLNQIPNSEIQIPTKFGIWDLFFGIFICPLSVQLEFNKVCFLTKNIF